MNRAFAACFGAATSLLVLSSGFSDIDEALWVMLCAIIGGGIIGLPTARWAQAERAEEPEIQVRPDGFDARLVKTPPTQEILMTMGLMWVGLCCGGVPFLSVLELIGYLVTGAVGLGIVTGLLVWFANQWTIAQQLSVTGRILTWNGTRHSGILPASVKVHRFGTELSITHDSGTLVITGFREQLAPIAALLQEIPSASGSREDVPRAIRPLVEGSGL